MSIYITGDTHIPIDIRKLGSKKWKEGRTLTKSDYLIILGDFGLIWEKEQDELEAHWKNWLNNKKWTTLFIDGNHENHQRLYALPQVEMFGGTVGEVSNSIYHLKRGQIYTIENKTFFCMGGADSYDKSTRKEGISWWPEEQPSLSEIYYAQDNLEKYGNKINYILTHTAPYNIIKELFFSYGVTNYYEKKDRLWDFFQQLYDTIDFKIWYIGHWHENRLIDKCCFLYEDIIKLRSTTHD